jgi:hypothetical protein
MTAEDAQRCWAGEALSGAGAEILLIEEGSDTLPLPYSTTHLYLVFVASLDRFPSKHIRVLSLEKVRELGITVPEVFDAYLGEHPVTVVIIKPAACEHPHELATALQNLHWNDPVTKRWSGPKRDRPSRHENLERRREERARKRSQYMLA